MNVYFPCPVAFAVDLALHDVWDAPFEMNLTRVALRVTSEIRSWPFEISLWINGESFLSMDAEAMAALPGGCGIGPLILKPKQSVTIHIISSNWPSSSVLVAPRLFLYGEERREVR